MVGETFTAASTRRRCGIIVAVAAAVSLATAGACLDAAVAPAHAESRMHRLPADLQAADALLRHVVRDGWVDYDRLEKGAVQLEKAIVGIAKVPPGSLESRPDPDRLAFFLNAYNLATLDLVARERRERRGRLKSIQEIPAAWSRPKWTVAGVDRTLDEIEHEIIRKEFREPRIHMALVCASVSCPALQPWVYTGAEMNEQLDRASRGFLIDPTRNQIAPRDGAIRLSKIFDWYGGDFVGVYRDSTLERLYGEKEGAVLAFAARYVPAETSTAWKAKRLKIEYLPYDWGLNDWSRNAAPAAKR
jgi:hypothetical protein